jgi:hypothetical protein
MMKLTLRYGDIELEYEGPEDFLKSEIPKLLQGVANLHGTAPPKTTKTVGAPAAASAAAPAMPPGKLSVSTAAQRFGAANGPDLIIAAAYTLGSDSSTFTKKQLRDAIREAKTYFKSSYANNFDNYVNTLIKKGRLNHSGGENYALSETELKALNAKLK